MHLAPAGVEVVVDVKDAGVFGQFLLVVVCGGQQIIDVVAADLDLDGGAAGPSVHGVELQAVDAGYIAAFSP